MKDDKLTLGDAFTCDVSIFTSGTSKGITYANSWKAPLVNSCTIRTLLSHESGEHGGSLGGSLPDGGTQVLAHP
jgi:hypothetical protein